MHSFRLPWIMFRVRGTLHIILSRKYRSTTNACEWVFKACLKLQTNRFLCCIRFSLYVAFAPKKCLNLPICRWKRITQERTVLCTTCSQTIVINVIVSELSPFFHNLLPGSMYTVCSRRLCSAVVATVLVYLFTELPSLWHTYCTWKIALKVCVNLQ